MKKQLYIICGLVLMAFFVLLSLNAVIDKPNKHRNGFIRNINSRQVEIVSHMALGNPEISICGKEGDSVFLSGPDPSKIYVANVLSNKFDTITLKMDYIPRLVPSFRISIAYPYAYILGGNARCLIVGNLLTRNSRVVKLKSDGVFSNGLMINENKFIVRVIDSATRNARFEIFDKEGNRLNIENNISSPLGDAGFTYAGTLTLDKDSSNRLTYVSYFTNNIVCFDTNLHLLYRSHTVDTNFTVKTSLKKGPKGVTNKTPPVIKNTYSDVSCGILYVKSKLMADNEQPEFFERSSVIDQYEIRSGKYIGSFYLPHFNKHPITGFLISNVNIVGITKNELVVGRFRQGKSQN